MNILQKYQIFFALRDKYPEHRKLISELMKYAFQNDDAFHDKNYLSGNFQEKDIKFIFEKLNPELIVKSVINSTLRSEMLTIVYLNVDIYRLP